MTATFATKSQTPYIGSDEFGFPFTFFSASNTGEVVTDTKFNLMALLGDLASCFVIAYGVVSVLYLLKVDKKIMIA